MRTLIVLAISILLAGCGSISTTHASEESRGFYHDIVQATRKGRAIIALDDGRTFSATSLQIAPDSASGVLEDGTVYQWRTDSMTRVRIKRSPHALKYVLITTLAAASIGAYVGYRRGDTESWEYPPPEPGCYNDNRCRLEYLDKYYFISPYPRIAKARKSAFEYSALGLLIGLITKSKDVTYSFGGRAHPGDASRD